MNIESILLIHFSPTGTTRKVITVIAENIGAESVRDYDLAPSASGTKIFEPGGYDLAVIGAPVYAGRIPPPVRESLLRLEGKSIPAVITVVYGNRAYDDALLELKDISEESGFVPVAGGAFIGEHSFADKDKPIAMGRPDAEDLKKAKDFGELIRKKLDNIGDQDNIPRLEVPGEFPYKEMPSNSKKIPPDTIEDLCTTCGTCASVCPTSAVTVTDTVTTVSDDCISCCACIKNCPTGARVLVNPHIIKIAEWLHKDFRERKEPEIYGV